MKNVREYLSHLLIYVRAMSKWLLVSAIVGLVCGLLGSAFHIAEHDLLRAVRIEPGQAPSAFFRADRPDLPVRCDGHVKRPRADRTDRCKLRGEHRHRDRGDSRGGALNAHGGSFVLMEMWKTNENKRKNTA